MSSYMAGTFEVQDSDLQLHYEKFMQELDDFYQLNWVENRPSIFVLSTKEEARKSRNQMGLPEFKSASGWVGSGGVYVVSKEIYNELVKPLDLDDQYLMLIKHELSHLFFQHVANFKSKPDWLWEGCAIYLSGQNKYKQRPEKFTDFLRFYEKNVEGNVYHESGFVIQLLVEKFGKEKLLELIKKLQECSSEEEFADLFQDIYNIPLSYKALNIL